MAAYPPMQLPRPQPPSLLLLPVWALLRQQAPGSWTRDGPVLQAPGGGLPSVSPHQELVGSPATGLR